MYTSQRTAKCRSALPWGAALTHTPETAPRLLSLLPPRPHQCTLEWSLLSSWQPPSLGPVDSSHRHLPGQGAGPWHLPATPLPPNSWIQLADRSRCSDTFSGSSPPSRQNGLAFRALQGLVLFYIENGILTIKFSCRIKWINRKTIYIWLPQLIVCCFLVFSLLIFQELLGREACHPQITMSIPCQHL